MPVRHAQVTSPDEELEDLQHKIAVLEGDRKSTYETTQQLIRANREALKQGKEENKKLRIALAQVQKDGMGGMDDAQEVGKLTELCAVLRKMYDDQRNEAAKLCDELEEQSDGLKDLERESQRPNQGDSPLTRQIRTLENRLDKAMIKYNEAQSIRKTYEQIVKRLKEERIGFDNQLAAVERTLKAKEHDLDELNLMLHDASHAKETAKQELVRLEDQLMEERQHREQEVRGKRAVAESKAEKNKRLAEQEARSSEAAAAAIDGEDRAGEELKESVVTNVMHHNLNQLALDEEEATISAYEEAFRKIKDATGVNDINEVIMKVISQEDTKKGLDGMTKEAEDKISKLNAEKEQLEKRLEELKYASSGTAGSREVVNNYEKSLAEANARNDRTKRKYKELHDRLINAKAGVEHLCDKLVDVAIETPQIPLSDETVVDVMAQCEQKLLKLMAQAVEVQAMRNDEERDDEPSFAADNNSSAHNNVRIKIEENDEEDPMIEHDIDGDDIDEDVMDREMMKRTSSAALEKQARRGRKGKGRRKMAGSQSMGQSAGLS